MSGKDGSRAISTCQFLLEGKTHGQRLHLDHAWNAHLTAANRKNSHSILKMFKSDWDDAIDAENEEGDRPHTSSCCPTPRQPLPDAAPTFECAASPSNMHTGSGAPARIICGPHARDTAALRMCPDLARSLQETAFGSATAEVGPSTLAQPLHSLSQNSNVPGSMAAMPAASISYPSAEPQLTSPAGCLSPACLPASTTPAAAAALLSPDTRPVSSRSARTTAEHVLISAQPAPGPPSPEESNAVDKALCLLWRVQANCKLPQCLQPPRPAHPQLHSLAPGALSSGSACNSPVTVRCDLAVAGPLSPAPGDAIGALVGGRPAGSNGCGYAGDPSLGVCTSPLNGQRSIHVHWDAPGPAQQVQLQGRQCYPTSSARSSAAAIAAVGAPGGPAPSSGPLVRRHTNGSVTAGSMPPTFSPLYEPTYQDLKPYLSGAPAEEGVEALIQRHLQQGDRDTALIPGVKLGKLPPAQCYMMVAGEHMRRFQHREQRTMQQL